MSLCLRGKLSRSQVVNHEIAGNLRSIFMLYSLSTVINMMMLPWEHHSCAAAILWHLSALISMMICNGYVFLIRQPFCDISQYWYLWYCHGYMLLIRQPFYDIAQHWYSPSTDIYDVDMATSLSYGSHFVTSSNILLSTMKLTWEHLSRMVCQYVGSLIFAFFWWSSLVVLAWLDSHPWTAEKKMMKTNHTLNWKLQQEYILKASLYKNTNKSNKVFPW